MVREYKGGGRNATKNRRPAVTRGKRVGEGKRASERKKTSAQRRLSGQSGMGIRRKASVGRPLRSHDDTNEQKNTGRKRLSHTKTVKSFQGTEKFSNYMQKKLFVLLMIFLFCFVVLGFRLYKIVKEDGDAYTRKILSQQYYSSSTIPYKRGDIVDKNGTILATSDKVYNVILDTVELKRNEECVEPTLNALANCFGVDRAGIVNYMAEYPNSRYRILKKECSYDEISQFIALQEEGEDVICGIWFEDQYVRTYPYGTLACDAIGFTNNDKEGTYGLEEYYNDTLSGSDGREYGYLNDDSALERTTIAAVDGYTIKTTLDMNIQSIVEKYLYQFNEEHQNEYREGLGAYNIGCVIMECNTGNILAMASYPNYDLNDPYNISAYYTEEQIQAMKDDNTYYATLNQLWRNFCISDSYEPGSVAKPFTVAAAIDCGAITGNETYDCFGSLVVATGTKPIGCHNRYGDGTLTVQQAVEKSCNVALMQIAAVTGKQNYLKYFRTYGFGLKTNIDLAGEARTASLVFNENTMGPMELATSSFGQGFNVTMIQTISAFNSLVNGGYYYEPHMVSSITTESGAVVENIAPRILRQTISEDTSALIRQYCEGVVLNGTGKNARPAGYIIGGKTGTAETVQNGIRDKTNYVVSFMGFAPVDDPQICIYVVVDRPNVEYQDNATKYATFICRDVLTEVLPYLGIYMTEELSEKEQEELDALGIYIPQTSLPKEEPVEGSEEGTPSEDENASHPEGAEAAEQE